MFRKLLFGTTCVLAGLVLGITGSSIADKSGITLDSGYSDCRHTPSPDGQWFQKDQDHSSRLKAGCGTFGLSIAMNDNWTAGIHYVSLGRTNVEALAVAFPGDDRANMTAAINPARSECSGSFHGGCLYHWHTGSFTRGVNFSLMYRLFNIGDVRVEAKGGLYAHKLSSHAIVEPMGCRDNCSWRVQVDQSAERIAPMYGVVLKWKYFYASWESYERIGAHTPVTANVKGSVEVKTIGVMIPI